jgi:hypothetical protein
MRFRKGLLVTILVIVCYSGCKKTDYYFNGSIGKTCDYSRASSNAIYQEYTNEISLFTKHYYYNSLILKSITLLFQNVAGRPHDSVNLKVSYFGNNMIFLDDKLDTQAIFTFSNNGRLLEVKTSLPNSKGLSNFLHWSVDMKFFYKGNKLTEIQFLDLQNIYWEPNWRTYLKLTYDSYNKNVSAIDMPGLGSSAIHVKYDYDYSRKANGQYYPDEHVGDFYNFLTFLRYLNIFPELQPNNLLIHSYISDAEYPGNIERWYTDHHFNSDGNLVSYKMKSIIGSLSLPVEDWNLVWTCNHN